MKVNVCYNASMYKKQGKKFKAVLFDLGKVILHFDFTPAFKRLSSATGLSRAQIENFFNKSGLEVLYDGGKITSKKFHMEIKKGLGHSLGFEEFKGIWNRIFKPNPEMLSLIRKLKPRYRLILVSNTNRMHFEYLLKRYPILRHFDEHVLSYKENVRKPDERIYRKAMRACLAKPHEIFYIDDRQDLTEAARQLGFHTFTYKNNLRELIQRMRRLEIL